jgi:predicted dehydrogenase
LTITGGHTIDALCHCLGGFRELSAFVVSQRDHIPLHGTGEIVAKTAPDQLVVGGIVEDDAVVSFQVRGGMARGTEFLLEIHGEAGDLQLMAMSRASMQRQELKLKGARNDNAELAELPIPTKYRWVPEAVPPGSPYNVAQLYRRLAEGILDGKSVSPGFDAAVRRHRLIDMITHASDTGMKQAAR